MQIRYLTVNSENNTSPCKLQNAFLIWWFQIYFFPPTFEDAFPVPKVLGEQETATSWEPGSPRPNLDDNPLLYLPLFISTPEDHHVGSFGEEIKASAWLETDRFLYIFLWWLLTFRFEFQDPCFFFPVLFSVLSWGRWFENQRRLKLRLLRNERLASHLPGQWRPARV